MTTDLDTLLAFDSLAEAERLTGVSYKESDATAALGLLMHLENGEKKRAALQATDDTHYNVPWSKFVQILEDEGFHVGYVQHFQGSHGVVTEEFLIAVSNRGLVKAETYTSGAGVERKVNSANLYFNLEISDPEFHPNASGSFNRDAYDAGRRVYIGYADLREGFRHTLQTYEEHGRFLTPWIETPWLWLLNYTETRDPRYTDAPTHQQKMEYVRELNQERLASTAGIAVLGL